MIKIRNGVFETNSSSTHTCIITTRDSLNRWIKGELLYVEYPDFFEKLNPNIYDYIDEDGFIEISDAKNIIITNTTINGYSITLEDFYEVYNKSRSDWNEEKHKAIRDYFYRENSVNIDDPNMDPDEIFTELCYEIEVFSYEVFMKRYEDLEYNEASKKVGNTEVVCCTWDGWDG